jgi:hypothetical protein
VATRRLVRAATSFFTDLDDQLPQSRSDSGEPTAHDFLVVDLIDVLDKIATRFDDLPLLGDDFDVRVLVAAGMLVPRFAVVARLDPDDTIALIALEIDLS